MIQKLHKNIPYYNNTDAIISTMFNGKTNKNFKTRHNEHIFEKKNKENNLSKFRI